MQDMDITINHFAGCGSTPTTCNPASCVTQLSNSQPQAFSGPPSTDFAKPSSTIGPNPSTPSAGNIVGSQNGLFRLTFVPGPYFPKYGGQITLGLPPWFDGASTNQVVFSDGGSTQCSSSQIDISNQNKVSNQYVIIFRKYDGDGVSPVTLECTNYKNPTFQRTVGPFTMEVKDNEEIRNLVAVYPSWTFESGPLTAVDLT